MAFNPRIFKTRTITAIFFAVVMLIGLLWNRWSFFILFSFIHFGCWLEYQRLLGLIDPGYKEITPFHKYGVMLAGWCLLLYFAGDEYSLFGLRLHELGWWLGLTFLFVMPLVELLFARNIRLKNIALSGLGLVYISLAWGLMMDLRMAGLGGSMINDNEGTPALVQGWHLISPFILFPLAIIISLWINDTMAYIVGSLIGKTPLTPISPKKTWEGTLGGIILSIVVSGLILSNLHPEKAMPGLTFRVSKEVWFILPAITAITGTFGDLLESKLKRMAGVKDSGSILPGHGGFLDRFDSMLLATPFAWLFVHLFVL